MSTGYLRYPDVLGDEIVFTADDDLWLAPLKGGRAWRLTHDRVAVRSPRFSSDGQRVAFVSLRGGNPDVWVLDRVTGDCSRLTWWGGRGMAGTIVVGWQGERVLVASTARCANGEGALYAVALDGTEERLPYGIAMGLAQHPSGAQLINTFNGRDSAMWKRYRGGTASKLWLDPTGKGEWERALPDEEAGCYSVGVYGDRFVFTSDIGDLADLPQAQLWSIDLTGGDLRQHTHHTDAEGYVRDVRTDGRTLVYWAQGRLYSMSSLGAKPKEIVVDLPVAAGTLKAPLSQVSAVRPDQGGDGSVLGWRGAVWYLTHRAGPARALADVPGVRMREPEVLGDTGQVVWVSDAGGVDALQIGKIDGSGEVKTIAKDKLGYVLHLCASPKGDKIAVISHDGRVSLVSPGTGRVTQIADETSGEPEDLTFSPDGRYLVWHFASDEGMQGGLRCCDTASRNQVTTLTSGAHRDHSPSFSRDGKYLLFLSNRTFDPRYSEHDFDLGFGPSTRPYLVPLRAEDPAPFGPSADGWQISEVIAAAAAEASAQPGEDKPEDKGVQCVIDLDGFEDRAIPLPVPVGALESLQCAKDGVLWIRRPDDQGELRLGRVGVEGEGARPVLERYSFTSRKVETIAGSLDSFAVTGDGNRIVLRDKETIVVAPADRKAETEDPMRITVDTSRLRREIDLAAEWRQMLSETHRLMTLMYWRDDMDGIDWDAVLLRYQKVLERCTTKDDVIDLLWEVVAELNTSHAYVFAPMSGDLSRAAASLGADLHREASGVYVIDAILPGESTNPHAVSPLLAAGVGAKPGDRIVAVDGRRLDATTRLGSLLEGAAGKVVELTLKRGRAAERRVAVVPIANEAVLRYHQWVASRKAYVAQKSGGRVGYVHVPDMVANGWAQFQRDIGEATRCEAIIADVRFNAGGHTSQMIIERLARKVVSWGFARHIDEPETYPYRAARGPVLLVTNQFAGSDGDIVNAVAQGMQLGPVIGERTWGGVIGIDGRYDLVDGTSVTQPRYSCWFPLQGWGLENHGVDPDITVELSPSDWDSDNDLQLDVAVVEALRLLEETPAATAPAFPPPRVQRSRRRR